MPQTISERHLDYVIFCNQYNHGSPDVAEGNHIINHPEFDYSEGLRYGVQF